MLPQQCCPDEQPGVATPSVKLQHGAQTSPQLTNGFGQRQAPFWQTMFSAQTVPHAPQCRPSLWVKTHAPSQQVCPLAQVPQLTVPPQPSAMAPQTLAGQAAMGVQHWFWWHTSGVVQQCAPSQQNWPAPVQFVPCSPSALAV